MTDLQQHLDLTDSIRTYDLSDIPEPPEPEEILGTKASEDPDEDKPARNPFTGKFWRLPDLLSREFTEDWLVDGLFCRGDLVVLYGPAKSCKTFVALDMGMSLATGRAWSNNRFSVPKQRTVVYCAGEGIRGLKRRWESLSIMYEPDADAKSRIITVPLVPQLFQQDVVTGAAEQFVYTLKEELPDEQIDLVIIDTLNRASVGANENSAQDVGIILQAASMIQNDTGAAVMLIHHADKQGATLRGSSALRAAVDVALKVDPKPNNRFHLICDAIKDGERFDPIAFELFPVCESVTVNWIPIVEDSPSKTYADMIYDYLKMHPQNWYASSGIASETGIQKNRVCEALNKLEANNMIECSLANPEKPMSSRNPHVYRIKQTGK